VARSSPVILAVRRGNSADTLAGALTPKAIIWNVMQITKIHFVDLGVFLDKLRAAKKDLTSLGRK
jgi:hypothetical protein